MATTTTTLLLAAALLAPPLIFLTLIRFAERQHREAWKNLLAVFLASAIGAAGLSFALESSLRGGPFLSNVAATFGLASAGVALSLTVAPLVEELSKALPVGVVPDDHPEREDGLIYGAAAGLGFATAENALFMAVALVTGGTSQAFAVLASRTISSTLLHLGASALAGDGVWAWRHDHHRGAALGLVGLAIVLHAFYNLVATRTVAGGVLVAIVVAAGAAARAWWEIHHRDTQVPPA